MGKDTAIGWTNHTFNPWWGCSKVSPGCAWCYAERDSKRFFPDLWGPASTTHRRTLSDAYWRQPLSWDRAAAAAGKQALVFCASMADWLEDHPDLVEPRARLADLIEITPWLNWLLLTKRLENFERLAPERWLPWGNNFKGKLPCNVWLGISAENQDTLTERWPVMENVAELVNPSVIFLSCEPLLGMLDLTMALDSVNTGDDDHDHWSRPVDWVIAGGESGPHLRDIKNARRIMPAEWAVDLRDQCAAYGVPYFFKQHGGWQKIDGAWGGDLLEGKQYHEFPNVTRA